MEKKVKKKIVKDYSYWQIHKEIFNNHFWKLDNYTRQTIIDNPYCREAKVFEKKLESLVEQEMSLTPA